LAGSFAAVAVPDVPDNWTVWALAGAGGFAGATATVTGLAFGVVLGLTVEFVAELLLAIAFAARFSAGGACRGDDAAGSRLAVRGDRPLS